MKVLVTNIGCGHFDLTFQRSRTQSTAVVEQKIESAYLKYIKKAWLPACTKMPLEVIFPPKQAKMC